MVLLKFIQEGEYNTFTLINEDNSKQYSLVLECYNMQKPTLNSYLKIDERLLDPHYEDYCQPYAFEPTTENDFCAVLIEKDRKVGLRRIYG